MVDPNPFRGMPLQLTRYWLGGKGALKIRWGFPGDFGRCTRALRKYFPANPEGLCNILHTKALGAPPGKGHPGEAALVAATELMARQPKLGEHLWMARIVPIGVPTGEPRRTRVFEPGSLSHRTLPLPFSWRKASGQGHDGSVMVGRVLGIHYGPDHQGAEYAWGWGDYFDESYVAETKEARYLADQGVLGCSIDPGGKVVVSVNPANGWEYTSQYVIGGVTTVSIPAFTEMSVLNFTEEMDWWDEDDEDMVMPAEEVGCDCEKLALMSTPVFSSVYAVNPSGWQGVQLAPRETVFDNDDAVKRIAAWAGVGAEGADVAKLQKAFLWQDPQQPETQTTSYRMPLGDIINNELVMIYHAIYAAAALISGAHGGLPGVPEQDKNQLRNIITDVYKVMAEEFNDSSIRAPWDRPENEGEQFAMAGDAKMPYGDVAYADPGYQKDGKKRYPLDTEAHCRAAWSYINQADNADEYTPKQLKLVRGRIMAALKKYGANVSEESGMSVEYAMSDSGFPVTPSAAWFNNPALERRTPLTVSGEGQVYGHLAVWGECHRDVTNRECVIAPHSQMEYVPFHLGQVITAEGDPVQVGKIVMDTRHADIRLGYTATALHYDDTGDEVAVVRAGEDEYGIWLAGAIIPEADDRKVAKLRRSPLSGDWRAVNGHLELTAALAVNVPAFPVYAMEGDEQTALVAAGTLYPEPGGYQLPYFGINSDYPVVDMDVLAAGVIERMRLGEAQDDRGWRLRELVEEDQQHRGELLVALRD